MSQQPKLKLVVQKGSGEGRAFLLDGRRFLIGRGEEVDLSLDDDDFVSRGHAEIVWIDTGPVVKNLSRNGTLVNGHPATDRPLVAGDRISLGLRSILAICETDTAGDATTRARSTGTRPAAGQSGHAAQATDGRPEATGKPAPRKRVLSPLLTAYLAVMALLFVGLATMRLVGSDQGGVAQVARQEAAYAAKRSLDAQETKRTIELLELAATREVQGDRLSAYEIYRDVLAQRHPPDPRAPAYRFAARKGAALAKRK